jgi:hypothetical protein
MALGRILLLDDLQLFGRAIDEHVFEELVERATALDRGPGGSALIQNRHRRPVCLGLLDRVAVDELAEDLAAVFALGLDDRRAREADLHTVGQCAHQVGMSAVGMAPMRLVHQHEDSFVGVEHGQRLRAWAAFSPFGARPSEEASPLPVISSIAVPPGCPRSCALGGGASAASGSGRGVVGATRSPRYF